MTTSFADRDVMVMWAGCVTGFSLYKRLAHFLFPRLELKLTLGNCLCLRDAHVMPPHVQPFAILYSHKNYVLSFIWMTTRFAEYAKKNQGHCKRGRVPWTCK